ncbi:MAG: methyltransferase domain-containing protein [Thermoplasmata archaeon]|nr:methyltransferase domain-containing protein [Thermoplasmata archaeon]
MTDVEPLREGETILLRRREQDAILLVLRRGPTSIEGRGIVDLTEQIGQRPGTTLSWAGATYTLLRPSLTDLLGHLKRRAQIVTPKDAQYLLYLAGVAPGSRVAEAGAGSGALTIVLAHAVGPTGRVYSFDRRTDFLDVARRNVTGSGLAARVTFEERDVAQAGFGVDDLDSVLLDLPEPWAVLPAAKTCLRPGGYAAVYVPTYNQLETSVRRLRSEGFEEIRSVELLERALHVGEGGTRPEFEMLGHTGFLASGRRVG